jgi:hypothetical protein
MKTYRLVMMTRLASVPWEYEFGQPSDNMAIEAAKRMIGPPSWPEGCMSILLFEMEERRKIAEFNLKPAAVEVR